MSDLEPRLRRALRALPEGSEQARRRAEEAALAALPQARRRRSRWVLATCGAFVAVAIAGAALAATDRLEVRIGAPAGDRPAVATAPPAGRVVLPAGAAGLGVVADGRLWLRTSSGLGVQGLAVTTAELSPQARYAAVGIGRSLVAMAPDGRRAWSHATAGPVAAAAWAPNPIAIAYVVRNAGRHELRVIEGDGDGDRLVDGDVAPVRPSWRADTLALAYVGSDGAAHVAAYPSLGVERRVAPPRGRVTQVAYAPSGDRLALATAKQGRLAEFGVVAAADIGPWTDPGWGARIRVRAIAWSSPDELAVAGDERRDGEVRGRLWLLPASGRGIGKARASQTGPPIAALSPPGADARMVVAVRSGAGLEVWEVATPRGGGERPLTPRRVLLRVPADGRPVVLTRR